MRKALLLFVLCLTAACSRDEPDPPKAQITPQNETQRTARRSPEQRELASAGLPLPLQGLTLKQAIPELRERIGRGDAVAACQLARELDFCAGSEEQTAYLRKFEAARSARRDPANPSRTDPATTLTDLATIRGEYCAGVSEIPPSERVALWRQAAERGHVPSMVLYGSGLAFRGGQTLATLDALRLYKQDGVKFVERAARAGNFQSNLLLARAFAPQLSAPDRTPLLRQAVQRNAATSYAYYRIARDLLPTNSPSAPSELQLQTEMGQVAVAMSQSEISASDQIYGTLRGAIAVKDRADVDIESLNAADVNQPVPGVELCGGKKEERPAGASTPATQPR